MKLYRFLTGPDDASFCHKVTAALNKGWVLSGSPTYTFNAATSQIMKTCFVTEKSIPKILGR